MIVGLEGKSLTAGRHPTIIQTVHVSLNNFLVDAQIIFSGSQDAKQGTRSVVMSFPGKHVVIGLVRMIAQHNNIRLILGVEMRAELRSREI